VRDACLRSDPIPHGGASAMAVDDERHPSLENLPVLGLVGVEVFGNVAAWVGLDLSEQIIAVAREPIALPTDGVDHYVTHG
jgi:hypothetical protein